jgi:hypothetical protein
MSTETVLAMTATLDASGVESGARRAHAAVSGMAEKARKAGGDSAPATASMAKYAPQLAAGAASIARVAGAALAAAGKDAAAQYLTQASAGAVQFGAALAPLGPAAMVAGAGIGALSGALSTYFNRAKAAREETERLAKAARESAAEGLVGDMRTKRAQSRLATADGADEIRKRIQAMRDRDEELTRLIDTGLATPAQTKERRNLREEMPGWENAQFRAEQSTASRATYERAAERRKELDLQAKDSRRRAAELANVGQAGITREDRHAIAMSGASGSGERIALLEKRAKDLEQELRTAIKGAGGKKGWDEVDAARDAVRSNAVALETARQEAEAAKKKKPALRELPALVRPGSVDAMQSKGWGAVSSPWAGLEGLAGAQKAAGSVGGPNTLESLAREQRDLLRRIAEALRPGSTPAPAAVYAK